MVKQSKWEEVNVKVLLKELGISSLKAAVLLGVAQLTIIRWASRSRMPRGKQALLRKLVSVESSSQIVLEMDNLTQQFLEDFARCLTDSYPMYIKRVILSIQGHEKKFVSQRRYEFDKV